MSVIDIRQSDAWSNYLTMYGWTSYKLAGGGLLRIARLPFFSLAKIHRVPCLFSGDLKEVESICKTNRLIYTKVSPSLGQDLAVLESFGYKRRGGIDLPPRTAFIDLQQNEDVLWSNLTKDCRYCVTKSTKANDKSVIVQSPSELQVEEYHRVLNDRGHSTHYYVPSVQDHLEKVKCFGEEAFIATAYTEQGSVLGVKMFLGYNGCVWYMYSGLTKLGVKSCGNYKLMWDSIIRFKKLGYKVMDLEGLCDSRLKRQTKKWKHYSDYKMQFGGTATDYPLPYSKYQVSAKMPACYPRLVTPFN